MRPMTASELRRAFLGFFEERGHVIVPSSSLIPHDPSLLLTTAGMVQFKPYMLGDEQAPYSRASSVQKCFRTTDIDLIGTTARHLTFFEMLGNFSLGDYFKTEAIPFAWELVTEVLALDPDRCWVTVFEDDDDAEEIWSGNVGVSNDRIQRMGAEDNFWAMGTTGPCGPCSEIYFDRGPEFGEDGGPLHGGDERYVEIWNLVFMQFNRDAQGTLHDLPRPNIDTGAGLERILAVLQGEHSVFETDVLRPMLSTAEEITGVRYGGGVQSDVSLRILAEHGRAMSFLIGDGVFPSNEERGYVLRRIIRRAVRHAYLLGVERNVTPALVATTVDVMGDAYPELVKQSAFIEQVATREEERFRQTLRRGLDHLDDLLANADVSGEEAFFLHDTLGFPVEVTREIAAERGRQIDLPGFQKMMEEQRQRAKQAHRASQSSTTSLDVYREVYAELGTGEFRGYQEHVTPDARVLALINQGERVEQVEQAGDGDQGKMVEVVLDRTPFYAEAGGQVGDVGTITGPTGELRVIDTAYALPGTLVVHRCQVIHGVVMAGDVVEARIDVQRRERIRRNHTATHLLHGTLREVLGSHVKQAGSLVAPDRLRFDFSHYEAVGVEQLGEIESRANAQVLENAPVRAYETTKDHAEEVGAIAFFGDKYGDVVRVVEAGDHSVELCGGTHVHALGMIGPIKILSESSVGANMRRIEAVTGEAALKYLNDNEAVLRSVAEVLETKPAEAPARVAQLVEQLRSLERELASARNKEAVGEAVMLAADADGGLVVERRDGATVEDLRRLALAVRDALRSGVVVLVGAVSGGTKAGLVVAVSSDLQQRGVAAGEIAADAARALGGGTAKNPDLVTGGGPNVAGIAEALELAGTAAREALAAAQARA